MESSPLLTSTLLSTLRVVTYNVLSSSLSQPSYFFACSEKHVNPKNRYELLEKKLEIETHKESIVCLQELSLTWSGKLHTFFNQRGYTLIASNYGQRHNGYMGCGIAFPRSRYSLEFTDISTIADTKPGGWNAPGGGGSNNTVVDYSRNRNNNTITNHFTRLFKSIMWATKSNISSVMYGILSLIPGIRNILTIENNKDQGGGRTFRPEDADPWSLAKSRFNTMITLRLHPNSSSATITTTITPNDSFLISTYHMPCIFTIPAVMTIHSALALQRVQQLSEGKYPYIFGGDFNFKPRSPQYILYTTGILPSKVDDPEDKLVHGLPAIPALPAYEGDKWSPTFLPRGPVRSAYAEVQGKEPEFTNYALTGNDSEQTTTTPPKQPFKGTLDYLFVGNGQKFSGSTLILKPVEVLDLTETCKNVVLNSKSLPNENEPSDHLLLATNFELWKETTVKEG
jgi:mRNA deadenylase 3'-5' endonuclease subunit Ccr4